MLDARRQGHRGGVRGALHAEEARSGFSDQRHPLLPRRGQDSGQRPRLRRLLRKAVHQVQAPVVLPRRLLSEVLRVVLARDAVMAAPKAHHPVGDRGSAAIRRAGVHDRAPPLSRRQRLSGLAVSRGGVVDGGRRRRMVDGDLRSRQRFVDRPVQRDPLPAFARAALYRVHLVPRLQGEQRRVQGHGLGALRGAAFREGSPRAHRRRRRRQLPSEHGVFRLPLRVADDDGALPPALRRATARSRGTARAATQGPRGEHPSGDRRRHAEDGAPSPSRDGAAEPLHGRRRRAQLRRQWTDRPRGALSGHLRAARGR